MAPSRLAKWRGCPEIMHVSAQLTTSQPAWELSENWEEEKLLAWARHVDHGDCLLSKNGYPVCLMEFASTLGPAINQVITL